MDLTTLLLVAIAVLLGIMLGVLLLVAGRTGRTEWQVAVQTRLDGIERLQGQVEQGARQEIATLAGALAQRDGVMRQDVLDTMGKLSAALREDVAALVTFVQARLAELDTRVATLTTNNDAKIGTLTESNEARLRELRQTVDDRIGALQRENAEKLDQMRIVVEEKLQNALEQRLGESFRMVGERLEQVHKGLGEMQTLASGVGDLKKVLANVKTRGTWGEVQLTTLLDQFLTRDQYATNIATRPHSNERVEVAIRLPGRERNGDPVWLPIDAKFPLDDYQRIVEASERADAVAVEDAIKALETRLRVSAKEIRDKYIESPFTTDFAVLFVPTEGLCAEVLRRPALVDRLQREFHVVVAGPNTLWMLLNSLQMGFRTLQIEQRSSEVWETLGKAKQDFATFGDVMNAVHKKLQEATNKVDEVRRGTRRIQRTLREVDAPGGSTADALADVVPVPLFAEAREPVSEP